MLVSIALLCMYLYIGCLISVTTLLPGLYLSLKVSANTHIDCTLNISSIRFICRPILIVPCVFLLYGCVCQLGIKENNDDDDDDDELLHRQERDLDRLRNATDGLNIPIPKPYVKLTTQKLMSSIDQLQDAVEGLPLVERQIRLAGQAPTAASRCKQTLLVRYALSRSNNFNS